jgi:hypothetical protein
MKSIRESINFGLNWSQPKAMTQAYELHAAGEVVGRLTWLNMTGSLAKAETAEGIWTFKRVGFLSPKVSSRVAGTEKDIALFEPSFTGAGWLNCESGLRLRWKSTGFWHRVWSFSQPDEQPLVSFKSAQTLFKAAAEVEIAHAARDLPELSYLVCMGWYLVVLSAADAGDMATLIAIMG